MAIIPETDSKEVAMYALAWEIVVKSGLTEGRLLERQTAQVTQQQLTNAVIDVYLALANHEKIGEPSTK